MSLIEVPLPPGVWKNGSKREAKGRFYDCNLIRWKNGKLKPLGGWTKVNNTALTGTPRTVFPFVSNNGTKYLVVGSNSNIYAIPGSTNTPSDITPSSGLATGEATGSSGLGFGAGPYNGSNISKTFTSSDISVASSDNSFNDTATTDLDWTDYFTDGDFIQVSGCDTETSYNKTYPNYHEVDTVTATKIKVTTSLGSDVAVGDTITISKSRNYGAELYDTSTPGLVNPAGIWSFDMFGEELIASLDSDGKIYYWDSGSSSALTTNITPATVTAGDTAVPINNASILVSKERHVFALGANGEYRKVMWSTQGNYRSGSVSTYWTPASTNSAGSFDLETTGRILTGKKVGSRILVFTDADVHSIDYLGPPYVYSRRKLGDACGIISKQAIAVIGSSCIWMSSAGTFFIFDGVVRPLACDVSNHIKEDFNSLQNSIVYANTIKENNEVWFWYASADSGDINRYVIYNYAEKWWSIGKLIRTAYADSGVFEKPLGISANKKLYEHEYDNDTSTARTSSVTDPTSLTELSDNDRTLAFGVSSSSNSDTYAETGAVEIGLGERFAYLKQFVTDTSAGSNAVTLEVLTANTPDSSEVSTSAPLSTTGYTDLRASGRQMRLKFNAPFDQDFEINTIRADIAQGGRR